MRAAIYARYSTDHQREASIEDQVRLCRARMAQEQWQLHKVYSDHAISGATTLRPGYQQLLEDARNGEFDVVIAEALDRLSRDLENIAALHKQLTFASIRLITLSEGEITDLHVGLKGTMNALFLKDLALKTHRGLEGRVRKGFSGGGKAYGYDIVHEIDSDGMPVRGKRKINPEHQTVINRIFAEFRDGRSPKSIAHALNKESVPGPSGNTWGPSTIYGNWRRGTGILNNELYIGKLVWNRQRYIKDPTTGKRQARLNPEADWIIEEVPQLRLIDDDLWNSAKERQQNTRSDIIEDRGNVRSERARRPRYLLSNLLKCGSCGGGFSKISQSHYGCSTARNKGTCDNLIAIRRDLLEETVLDGLKHQLMHPDCVKSFVTEFYKEVNKQAADQDIDRQRFTRELKKVEQDINRIVQAIKDGVPALTLKDELMKLESSKAQLQKDIEVTPKPVPRLHPNLAELYRTKVANLTDALNEENTRTEASEAIRTLIEEIRLVPEEGQLKIELYGEFAALINLTNENPQSKGTGVQVTLVAGARLPLFRTPVSSFISIKM
jgi:site-specific DNA recombinase